MRTKTLLLSAAALAAGLISASAQVYSVNVVGYINVDLTNGFTMLANQLDLDGTGQNNTVQTVFGSNLPDGSTVFAFTGGQFAPAATYGTKGGWQGGTNDVNAALNPGGGVFISVPSPQTITLVGNVMQGSLSTPYNSGFNIISSQVPQAGALQADLKYTPSDGDTIFQYDPATQLYKSPASVYGTKGGWSGNEPNVTVGEAFWLQSAAASGGTWVNNFTVQ